MGDERNGNGNAAPPPARNAHVVRDESGHIIGYETASRPHKVPSPAAGASAVHDRDGNLIGYGTLSGPAGAHRPSPYGQPEARKGMYPNQSGPAVQPDAGPVDRRQHPMGSQVTGDAWQERQRYEAARAAMMQERKARAEMLERQAERRESAAPAHFHPSSGPIYPDALPPEMILGVDGKLHPESAPPVSPSAAKVRDKNGNVIGYGGEAASAPAGGHKPGNTPKVGAAAAASASKGG